MIIIYALDYCPYCYKAIDIVKKKRLKYKIIWVTNKTKESHNKRNKMSTFPQIFYNNKKIGGYLELDNTLSICEDTVKFDVNPAILVGICKELS